MLKELNHYLYKLGIDIAYALAGGFGVVALLSKPTEMTVWQKLMHFIIGVGCAIYITPLLTYSLSLPNRLGFGIAFLVGYSGLKSFGMITKEIKDKLKKIK